MTTSDTDFDVAITGLGPTGAVLAALLADMGCRVLVLDREADIYDLPRAVHFDDEIMRVLQWIGAADRFKDKLIVNKGMRFVDKNNTVLLDWPRPQEVTSNGWFASYRFHQPDLERVLRDSLRERDGATILLSHQLDALQDMGDKVLLRYVDRLSGTVHHATAQFAVGCDGANSTVRRIMGSQMNSLGFKQRWLVVDVMLNHEMPQLGDFTLQYCDADTPATYCRNVGLRRRWEFALPDDQTDQQASEISNVWQRLSRWLEPEDAQIERRAIYTFRSEVAGVWVKGRLMIAGDAAHLTPPFMGQGLCAGIRDAANLAWKLARCCRDESEIPLLKTYETERKPNAAEYIGTAVRLGELINRMGNSGKAEKPQQMQDLQNVIGPGIGRASDPARGKTFSQPVLKNGKKLDDEIGHELALITVDPVEPREFPLDVRVIDARVEPPLADLLGAIGATSVLLRPDKRIFAVANSPDQIKVMLVEAAEQFRNVN